MFQMCSVTDGENFEHQIKTGLMITSFSKIILSPFNVLNCSVTKARYRPFLRLNFHMYVHVCVESNAKKKIT